MAKFIEIAGRKIGPDYPTSASQIRLGALDELKKVFPDEIKRE